MEPVSMEPMSVKEMERRREERMAERAERMPTEADAIQLMFECRLRLKEAFGWRDVMYAPRGGSRFLCIELGSTGVHTGYRDDKGRFWVVDEVSTWPSHPVLFKPITPTTPIPGDPDTP